MQRLESGKDKVKKICDILRRETLEPAERQAEELLSVARRRADEILADAHIEAEKMVAAAQAEVEKQRLIFQTSLGQACRQSLDTLKEKIEKKLFNSALAQLVMQPMRDPQIIAGLITAVVRAIEKEGTRSDLRVAISSSVSVQAVNEWLASDILQRLQGKGVVLSTIGGGIEVKLVQNHMTLDLSDTTLQELVASYIRKEFRKFLFNDERPS